MRRAATYPLLLCFLTTACADADAPGETLDTLGDETDGETADTPNDDPEDPSAGPTGDSATQGGTTGVDPTAGDESSGGPVDPTDASASDTDAGETGGGESTGEGEEFVPSLNQAAFNPATGRYEFGHNSIPNMDITGAPDDVDWTRWAMLHDGADYRLYFLPVGEADELIQFAFNPATQDYEWGFNSIPRIPITGAPADADPSSIAMLHDGGTYRLYFLSETAPLRVHQFGFDPAVAEYVAGYNSIPEIDVTGTPVNADWNGWGMLFDGATYRLYAFGGADHSSIVQHGFNPGTSDYEWGHDSIPEIDLASVPANSNLDDFAMLHDGDAYRLYVLTAE